MLFVLTGPESTAKSALTAQLSEHFEVPAIGEAAREYLQAPVYQPSDLLAIADLQMAAEIKLVASRSTQPAQPRAFADTDLQVLYVWWQERFGPVPTALGGAYARQSQRHYLLCEPDIEWRADPLRENPADRGRLFAIYEADLRARMLPYSRISGSGRARFDRAVHAVEAALDAG